MEAKHTPGPWTFEHGPKTLVKGPHGEVIADVKRTAYDARLMAAAPDMLRALTDLLAWCERYAPPESHHYELTGARAAIAKAEGAA